jgi:hypothetical protein
MGRFDWVMIVATWRSKNQPIYLYFSQNMTIANRKTNAEVATPIINLVLYSTCAYLNLTSRVDSNENQCDEGKPSCKRCLKNQT